MTPSQARGSRESDSITLPAPTVWPMVTALGVTLMCGGLVTHAAVSAVGVLLALIGAVGWWREVLPQERVEYVPLRPPSERARPVVPSPATVEHLRVGEAGHRVRVPVEVQPYSAGMKGGGVGGTAMAVVALIYGVLAQDSLWYPINLLAGMAIPGMEDLSVAQLRAFNLPALIIGTLAHGVISVLAGLLYAVILPMLPLATPSTRASSGASTDTVSVTMVSRACTAVIAPRARAVAPGAEPAPLPPRVTHTPRTVPRTPRAARRWPSSAPGWAC